MSAMRKWFAFAWQRFPDPVAPDDMHVRAAAAATTIVALPVFRDILLTDATAISPSSCSPLQVSSSLFVYPCIMMAYLGQGAHLIKYPEDAPTAFWSSVPDLWFWSVPDLLWICGATGSVDM